MEMAELAAALEALGASLPRSSGLAPSAPTDEAERVPAAQALEGFAAAEAQLADRLVGIHAARQVKPRGALVHLILSAASLRHALDYLARFSRLLIDSLSAVTIETPRGCTLELRFDDPALANHRQLVEYCLLATSRVLRSAVGEMFRLDAVHFRHASPVVDCTPFAEAFDCPVLFDQAADALVFPAALLDASPTVANPLVAGQMERLALALAARHAPPASLRERVAAALRTGLAAGLLRDRASVARELAQSEATLNRHLAVEGTSFREVREAVRWEMAEALLANPGLKLAAIAASVGFNDAAAFAHALKRRYEKSPSQLREALLAESAGQPVG